MRKIIFLCFCALLASCSSDEGLQDIGTNGKELANMINDYELVLKGYSIDELKKEKDYVRSVGKSLDIKLYKAIDKQKEFTGILKENMEDQIVLTIEDQDITFEKKSIASARLSLDF